MLLNPRGPEATPAEADALLEAVAGALEEAAPEAGPDRAVGSWLVASGSLLPGLAPDFYARAGRLARSRGARFVPDGDGEALAAAVGEADLLVPNAMEAGRLVGAVVETPEPALEAVRALLSRGTELLRREDAVEVRTWIELAAGD